MDANLGRALVRMAVGGNQVDVSELFLKPVSAKEYKDSSRVLSKCWNKHFFLCLNDLFGTDSSMQIKENTMSTKPNKKRIARKKKRDESTKRGIRKRRDIAAVEVAVEVGIAVVRNGRRRNLQNPRSGPKNER